ncbi:AraC family transcriptional regulator [Bacillus sp. LLTC93]|uniref:AraC family transcriptional regulator n=1 Tax=Bacillus sp. LLTC93 TaxID=2108274 RepID=UPI000D01952B|nr:helix-turn-helix domain-containing protein [Bacillus sp. LLTC93]PRO41703.1 AraC family transcriptional regulator [Bacillus sp. LLTC93]
MTDGDKLANLFARGSFDIQDVYRLVIQPNSTLREFKAENHGFLFTIRGEARMSVNGMAYELQPGSVLHVTPKSQLALQVIGQSEYEYHSLFYSLDRDKASECNKPFKLEPGANPRVIELLTMLHQNVHTPGGMGKLRVKELSLRIMYQVLMGCKQRDRDSSPNKRVIEEAVAYIRGQYMNPLTLHDLAELYDMNPKSFSYFFHKYTGLHPIDYVIQYRMERAREILKAGNIPIRDVAVTVGYPNPLYFSRVFKKKFGVSPSAYISKLDHHL